VTLHIPEDVT